MDFAKQPSQSETQILAVFDLLSQVGVPTETIERLIAQATLMEEVLQDCITKVMEEVDKNPSPAERVFLKSAFFGGMGITADRKAEISFHGLRASLKTLARKA